MHGAVPLQVWERPSLLQATWGQLPSGSYEGFFSPWSPFLLQPWESGHKEGDQSRTRPWETGTRGRVKGKGRLGLGGAHSCCPPGLGAWGPQVWVPVQEPAESTDQQMSTASFPWPLPHRECEQASVLVETTLSLVPCLNDCGPYGQCLLLRRHSYLYAGCSCKAGEGQAWTPPDTFFFF